MNIKFTTGILFLLCGAFSVRVSAEVTTIGVLAELSGPYARLGSDCRQAYEVALQSAPPSVRVVFGDNQSDPKVGISEFRRMVNVEGASIIVTTRSPVGLALNPLSLQSKVPLIGVIGHPRFTSENPYAIRVYPSAADEAEGLAALVRSNMTSSLAVVTVEDEYFLGLKDAFEAKLGHDKIVVSETVAATEHSFGTVAARIKAKSPSALFINVAPTQMGSLLKRMREIGINIPIYSNFLVGSSDVRKELGPLAEGMMFVEVDYQKAGFLKLLSQQSRSSETSPIGYGCYVGLTYALQLVEYATTNKVSLVEAQKRANQITTSDGAILLREREAKFDLKTKVIRNGIAQSLG